MDFWLGVHRAVWLERTDVPLFVSRRHLENRRSLPRALGPWALDSGGFTELSKHGGWDDVKPKEYAAVVRRVRGEVGNLTWAAPQDWMCEPAMLERTGLSVADHQRLTVDNFLELRTSDADLPWIPVLQGWTTDDYWRCLDLYEQAGIDLTSEPLVGLGTVCRRQDTREIAALVAGLAFSGLNLHGFGFKITGLTSTGWALASADSMAWSLDARWTGNRCGGAHKTCANCLPWALAWRESVLRRLTAQQPAMFGERPVKAAS